MKSKLIELTDGSKLEVKVNFYTLYLVKMNGIDKKIDGKSELTDDENMELAGKLIYIILRSNGLKVDEEEAMMLTPMSSRRDSMNIKKKNRRRSRMLRGRDKYQLGGVYGCCA